MYRNLIRHSITNKLTSLLAVLISLTITLCWNIAASDISQTEAIGNRLSTEAIKIYK